MRPITRKVALVILGIVVLLIALGALPGYLKSGDPYYMSATETGDNRTAVDSTNLSERRFEYTWGALATAENGSGTSDPYWKGPFGIKGAFTHSPFDEISSFRTQYGNATDGDRIFVRHNGTLYRLEVTQRP